MLVLVVTKLCNIAINYFDAKKAASCKWVLVLTKLVVWVFSHIPLQFYLPFKDALNAFTFTHDVKIHQKD